MTVILSLESPSAFMRQLETQPDPLRRQRQMLRAVATFEFFQGIFVVVMGVCALVLLHRDVWLYA